VAPFSGWPAPPMLKGTNHLRSKERVEFEKHVLILVGVTLDVGNALKVSGGQGGRTEGSTDNISLGISWNPQKTLVAKTEPAFCWKRWFPQFSREVGFWCTISQARERDSTLPEKENEIAHFRKSQTEKSNSNGTGFRSKGEYYCPPRKSALQFESQTKREIESAYVGRKRGSKSGTTRQTFIAGGKPVNHNGSAERRKRETQTRVPSQKPLDAASMRWSGHVLGGAVTACPKDLQRIKAAKVPAWQKTDNGTLFKGEALAPPKDVESTARNKRRRGRKVPT
jgi:hypothetical protein